MLLGQASPDLDASRCSPRLAEPNIKLSIIPCISPEKQASVIDSAFLYCPCILRQLKERARDQLINVFIALKQTVFTVQLIIWDIFFSRQNWNSQAILKILGFASLEHQRGINPHDEDW